MADKKENAVFVGKKPIMGYVMAAVKQLEKNNEAIIKARGQAISKAVDVAEIVRSRFVQDAKSSIKISTEEIDADGEKISVSVIEICMKKAGK